jgi:hypothetical protein
MKILHSLERHQFAQVAGYNKFGFVKRGESHVVVSRENGKDTRIPFSKIAESVSAVRRDPKVYSEGPSRLRQHGITHITSPLWALLHLLTLEELRA